VLAFRATREVSRPERFSQRTQLPRRVDGRVDGMIRAASASYLHGHSPVPGPATGLADRLRVLEEAPTGAQILPHPFTRTSIDDATGSPGEVAGGGAVPRGWDRPLPPWFAHAGTRDPLLDKTRRLEKPLAGLNVPCEARYYPGGIHAFRHMRKP
jgi:acetyl esterase/lipase